MDENILKVEKFKGKTYRVTRDGAPVDVDLGILDKHLQSLMDHEYKSRELKIMQAVVIAQQEHIRYLERIIEIKPQTECGE